MDNIRIFTGFGERKGRDKKQLWACGQCGSYFMKLARYNDAEEIIIECAECERPMDLSGETGVIANPPEAGY